MPAPTMSLTGTSSRVYRLTECMCRFSIAGRRPGARRCARQYERVPLVDVTYDSKRVPADTLRRLAHVLPDVVAEAVACPEEPWTGAPEVGDIEIRFREKGPYDVGGLACAIEVRTKLFESRLADKERRAELVRAAVAAVAPRIGDVGVWLILHDGSWAQ
jgi:hypothetical protein